MNSGWLHKNTPENCSINVLKKKFLRRFEVLEFLLITRIDRIFVFHRALLETHLSINLCILVDYTSIHPKIAVLMSSKKIFVRFQVLEFFSTTRNDRIFLFPRAFFWDLYHHKLMFFGWLHKNTPIQYQCPQKKNFPSNSGSRIFFDYSKRPNFSFS